MSFDRLNYYITRARIAWRRGTFARTVLSFLRGYVEITAEVLFQYVQLNKQDRGLTLSEGFADHRQDSRHTRPNPNHIRRIIAAYKKSTSELQHAAPPFQIRGLWKEWIAVNYTKLIRALNDEDEAALTALFDNLNRERLTNGFGLGYSEYVAYRRPGGRLYIKSQWCKYRGIWTSLGLPPESIKAPFFGNPVGIFVNGNLLQINAFRHAYRAIEMGEWLRNIQQATVAEIGGGIGHQAYQMMQLCGSLVSKYAIFDIPEVASISSFYLLSALPDKRIRLFGEGEVSMDASAEYDVAVFPHYSIAQLPNRSVDIVHNASSLSEMDGESAREYLQIIERICRGYFSHINADRRLEFPNEDGTLSVNVISSELVPDPSRFKRMFKKPNVFGLPEDRPGSHPYFEYLYEAMS